MKNEETTGDRRIRLTPVYNHMTESKQRKGIKTNGQKREDQ